MLIAHRSGGGARDGKKLKKLTKTETITATNCKKLQENN